MDAINFLESEEFLRIKRLMGISDKSKIDFTLEIPADDPGLEFTEGGFFYKGRRVILYIRDQVQYGDKANEYKFHVIECLNACPKPQRESLRKICRLDQNGRNFYRKSH